MPNELISESSPYLLQHAHNPVNWFPWGEKALQKAIDEDKPILVSIGYATCHWCHVMERESFEDEATAAVMNEHFINIKIDREERPDIDQIYMDAVQAMTGSGGWPLNVFLTPDKKPFYGGTYFPPKPLSNRASWMNVLLAVADAFKTKREELEQQADGMIKHLSQSNHFGLNTNNASFNQDDLKLACSNLLKQADKDWGGFGAAPKFPQTFSIQALLKFFLVFQNKDDHSTDENLSETALKQALLSLDKMIEGGLYDQLGGGFARYSTDREWLAPHFEKMLYDNALLIITLSEAYQITKQPQYKRVIEECIAFVERELMHPQFGFYAALDADSEGEEGKYYVWTFEEVQTILKEDAALFMDYFDVTKEGNWSESPGNKPAVNILRLLYPLTEIATKHNMSLDEAYQILQNARQKLLTFRGHRVRPSLDDKVILSWNALMNTALCKAYAATGNIRYKDLAAANMAFLLQTFKDQDHTLFHVWKQDQARYPAFLDDYAFIIQALLQLYRVSADKKYLQNAKMFCSTVIANFSAPDGYFYFTPEGQKDIVVRKKEVYDGATPSGNAVMAQNLLELSILFDQPDWFQMSEQMIMGTGELAIKYPTSFGVWLVGLFQLIISTKEIVLLGDYQDTLKELLSHPIPFSVVMAATNSDENYPLLKDKKSTHPLAIFVCENYACQKPVFSLMELFNQLS